MTMTTTFTTDKQTHQAFKVKCAAKDKAMGHVLTRLMNLYNKHGEKIFQYENKTD